MPTGPLGAKLFTFNTNGQIWILADGHVEFASSFTVQFVGTGTLTIVAEGTMMLQNATPVYTTVQMRPWNSDTAVQNITSVATSSGFYIRVDGMQALQLRCTAFTSGSADLYAKGVEG